MEKWIKTEKKLPPPHEVVEVRFVQHRPRTKTVSCLYEGTAYFREVPENRRGVSSGWVFHQLRLNEYFDFLGTGLTPTHWRRIDAF